MRLRARSQSHKMKLCATAPGKLVLLGEYAVLAGIPAVAMAVNRRAKVIAQDRDSPHQGQHILSSSLAPDKIFPFEVKEGSIRWLSSGGRNPAQGMFNRGVSKKLLIHLETAKPAEIHMDTQAFYDASTKTKLGLGSSAALSLALKVLGQQGLDMEQAMTAHHSNQGSKGSGIDVACSLHGGVIRFQREIMKSPDIKTLPLPADWHWCCVWSGQSASTPKMVGHCLNWAEQNPETWQALLKEAGEISEWGIAALNQGHARAWMEQISAYGRWMRKLGRLSNIPIVTKVHRELGKMASRYGVGYKPSGAGGGDVGIAFAPEAEQIKRLSEAAADSGHRIVPLDTDRQGLLLEKE